jgi:hypothetical protein
LPTFGNIFAGTELSHEIGEKEASFNRRFERTFGLKDKVNEKMTIKRSFKVFQFAVHSLK